jgi:hypothetical protein
MLRGVNGTGFQHKSIVTSEELLLRFSCLRYTIALYLSLSSLSYEFLYILEHILIMLVSGLVLIGLNRL